MYPYPPKTCTALSETHIAVSPALSFAIEASSVWRDDPFSYEIKSIRKLTYIPKSNPIYVKGKIYFIDKKKRIVSIN